jgi:hypothetical protein
VRDSGLSKPAAPEVYVAAAVLGGEPAEGRRSLGRAGRSTDLTFIVMKVR